MVMSQKDKREDKQRTDLQASFYISRAFKELGECKDEIIERLATVTLLENNHRVHLVKKVGFNF